MRYIPDCMVFLRWECKHCRKRFTVNPSQLVETGFPLCADCDAGVDDMFFVDTSTNAFDACVKCGHVAGEETNV